ncbi:MAG: ABC transporter permease [Spirochaetales bacterium]|nr:ABC transporter permease [Spirochaetales bacterium]
MRRYIILIVLLAGLLGLTVWMTALGEVGIFKMAPAGKVLKATTRHLQIVGAAEVLAILVGVPVGFFVTRRTLRYVSPVLIGIANIGQTVPTLAFIGIAGALLGMGYQAAVVALFVYAMLPIIRNTYAGIHSVDPAVIEAARGMGMSKWQITWQVELSLARPVIIAGIRTSTVVNVGTAAVAGMIGAGGLGELIVTGIAVRVFELIIQGAAPTAALAVILDALMGGVEEAVTPRGLKVLKQAQWQA